MAEERGKQYGQLVAKAWSDEGFKARLLANPKAAMAEVGMDAPEGVEIEVVESTQEKAYLVIPPKPVGELSDEDLDKVSAGVLPLLALIWFSAATCAFFAAASANFLPA